MVSKFVKTENLMRKFSYGVKKKSKAREMCSFWSSKSMFVIQYILMPYEVENVQFDLHHILYIFLQACLRARVKSIKEGVEFLDRLIYVETGAT